MAQPAGRPKDRKFAVAVRDGSDLFLWLRLRRNWKGEIFYVWATKSKDFPREIKWNPHGSKHKNGVTHHKITFDKKFGERRLQKPDANFKGTETLFWRGTAAHEPRRLGIICNPTEYDDVMVLSRSDLDDAQYTTHVSADLTERGGLFNIPGATILAQHRFDDAIPEILVTLEPLANRLTNSVG